MARTRRNASDSTPAAEPEVQQADDTQISQEGPVSEAPDTNQETEVTVETPEAPVQDEVQTTAEVPAQADAEQAQPEQAQPETTQAEAAPEGGDQAAAEPTPEDLVQAFKGSIELAYQNSDPSTGTAPEAFKQGMLTAYRALPNTARRGEVKAWLTEQLVETMKADEPNIPRARCLADLNNLLNESSARKAAAAPAKPAKSATDIFVEKNAAVHFANYFIVPTGEINEEEANTKLSAMVAELTSEASAYRQWLFADEATRGDAPEVGEVIKAAIALGAGRATGGGRRSSGTRRASSGGGTGGPRRDVGKHIAEFLASVQPGHEAAVSEIVNFASSEYTSDSPVSAGAVAARLWPKSGNSSVTGWEDASEAGGTRKIRKV